MLDDKKYKEIEKVKDKLTVNRRNLGRAGEYLVAARLLLNGFNVYFGALDDGIDLVARKRKKFYFLQVKTAQDLGYDSNKYMATVNVATFSKHPPRNTFLVVVLHYLPGHASPDFMGDHNMYDQMYIVLPHDKILDFFGNDKNKATFYLYNGIYGNEGWMVKMRYGKKDLILDEYIFDSFWQIEV